MYRVSNPSELMALLPALFGFACERMLTMVAVDRQGNLGLGVRVDLDKARGAVGSLARHAKRADAGRVFAVIVDGADGVELPKREETHRDLVAELRGAINGVGVKVAGVYVVDRLAVGGSWFEVGGERCGMMLDPATTPLAIGAAVAGRRIFKSRADLEAVVAADPDRVAILMPMVAAQGGGQFDRGEVVAAVGRAAAVVAHGGGPEDSELAVIAVALDDTQIRDQLYTLAVTDRAAEAEALWGLMARGLSDEPRANVLSLLALSSYVRGDGTLAQVAAAAALDAVPGHSMGRMIDMALRTGLPPEMMRRTLAGRVEAAAA